jgi:hypothetical protein
MSALKFRNITASVDDPVETWPFEGILTAVERGTLPDWRRLAAAVRADPWGPVAQQILQAVELSRPYGVGSLLTTVIDRARQEFARRRARAGRGRDTRPRRPVRPVAAGLRTPARHLPPAPVHLPVRQGHAVGRPRAPDAPRHRASADQGRPAAAGPRLSGAARCWHAVSASAQPARSPGDRDVPAHGVVAALAQPE